MNCTRRTALTAALGTGLINLSSPVFAKKRSDDLKPEKITDVIVVGFGGAGATTAITAADAGAKVLVLERQPKATLRSNTRLSAGIFHCPGKDGNADALAEYATAMFAGPNGPTVSAGEHDDISAELGKGFAQYATGLVDFMKKSVILPLIRCHCQGGALHLFTHVGLKRRMPWFALHTQNAL